MEIEIQVVFNHFGTYAGSFDAMVNRVLDAGVKTTLATSQGLARVDTGRMRSDVTISGGGDSRTMTWNAEYTGFNEFGTYKMSAQPFVRPGADAGLAAMQAEMGGWP